MNPIYTFVVLVICVNYLVYFVVPNTRSFMFNLPKFIDGEFWRYFTFPFVHLNLTHLVENSAGLLMASVLASELEIKLNEFISVFVISIFLTLLPILVLLPHVTATGNSMGVYGLFGMIVMKGKMMISEKITLPLFLAAIFMMSVIGFIRCGICFTQYFIGDFMHFSGFGSGLASHLLFFWKKKPRILRR